MEMVGKIPAEVVEIKCIWNNCPSIFRGEIRSRKVDSWKMENRERVMDRREMDRREIGDSVSHG